MDEKRAGFHPSSSPPIFYGIGSTLLGGNLASVLLYLRQRGVVARYLRACIFSWQMAIGHGLPMKRLAELLPFDDQHSLEIRLPPTVFDNTWNVAPFRDWVHLAAVARVLSPQIVFEIGTYHGQSALLFALNTPPDTKVVTLDLPRDEKIQPALPLNPMEQSVVDGYRGQNTPMFAGYPEANKITQVYGDSAAFDFRGWHSQVDLFFIDGAHTYEYVRSDTENALRCCHPGSVVLWHDYGQTGVYRVSQYLDEVARKVTRCDSNLPPTLALKGGRDLYRIAGTSLAYYRVPH